MRSSYIKPMLWVYFVCLLSGCSPKVPMYTSDCESYFAVIKATCLQKKNTTYSLEDERMIFNENKRCFIGCTTQDLIILLGEPNHIQAASVYQNKKIIYHLRDECLENKGDCLNLVFTLNEKEEVVNVYEPLIEQDDKW